MINKIWKISLPLSIIGIIALIILFIITNNINFKLNGNNNIKIDLYTNYIDEGYDAFLFKKSIKNKVKVINQLDINKIGTYKIIYNLSYLGKNLSLERTIEVIDNEIPIIKLNGKDEIILYINEEYIEEGATAYDNYDKDITNNIIIESNLDTSTTGNYEITYKIKDSSGNENKLTRKIIVKEKAIIQPTQTETYDINDPIIKYIKENNYDISIGYYNLITGKEYYYQENKIYYGASLIKTLDAIYIYDNNLVNEEIKNHINKAISISDNESHYYLLNYIGKNNLKNYGVNLGASNTLSGTDSYGNTTVKDQIVYLKKLYELSKNNEELKSYFINDYGNYLKINNLKVMHKYGYWSQYYHDVGIVLDDNPYIIVVLTKHGSNSYNIINNLSQLIYNYHKNSN